VIQTRSRQKKIGEQWRKILVDQPFNGETLEKDLELLRNESHPQYMKYVKALEKERDEKLELLVEWKEQQTQSIENTLASGIKGAQDEFNFGIETAKETLLNLCLEEKKEVRKIVFKKRGREK